MALVGSEPAIALDYDSHSLPHQPVFDDGWYERIFFPTPAAGVVNLIRFVPGNVWEQPVSLWARLIADATVASRVVFMEIMDDQGGVITRADTNQTVTAGGDSFWQYNLGENIFTTSFTGTRIAPMPNIIMQPGWQTRIRSTAGGPADQVSQIALLLRRWQNRPARASRGHPPIGS